MSLELKNRWLPCSKCRPVVYLRGIVKFLAHKEKNIHHILKNRCRNRNTRRKPKKTEDHRSCSECHKKFPSEAHMMVHRQVVHENDKSWQCGICSKTTASRANLTWHLIMCHTKEARFECTQCPKKFVTKAAGRKHLQEKHGI